MKYVLNIRSRPDSSEAVGEKHERFMRAVEHLPGGWGIDPAERPTAKDPGTAPMTIVKLTGLLGKGIKGSLNYANRKYLPDQAKSDDYLRLEFDPRRVDYAALVDSVLMRYVGALSAYVGWVEDEELMRKHFEAWQRAGTDYRRGVFRIQPVQFFDGTLTKRAFGLRPDEAARRLAGHVDRAVLAENGVYVVVNSKILPADEADRIERHVRPLLTG